jgi:hypothetical protein
MSIQLGVYLVIFIPLYHSSRKIKFIITSLYHEMWFCIKIDAPPSSLIDLTTSLRWKQQNEVG